MPRKKYDKSPSTFGGPGAEVTSRSRTRKIAGSLVNETGDPKRDGNIWLTRIAMTRRQRLERRNGEKDWRRYYLWYEGEQWEDRGLIVGRLSSDNARDTATANKTASIVNSMCPFLLNGQIRFLLKARRPQDDVSSQIQQALLNYEWNERGMTRQAKGCVKDLVIIGHCVAKTGYTVEVDTAIDPKASGEINYADYIREDAPWIQRVNPLHFLFDMSAPDYSLHSGRWCAEVYFVPLADVLANSNYDSEVLSEIQGGDWTPATRAAFEGVGAHDKSWAQMPRMPLPEDHLVALIEIWDKKYKHRIVYADGVPKPLLVEPWPYDYLDNFPYVMCNYIEVPNDYYGMGVPRLIEDQQLQKNRIRTSQFNHIRAHQRKFIASEEMDAGEVTKFTDGGDGTVVKGPPEGIKPIADAPMSQDFQIVEARIDSDMEEMTGADALLQGKPLPSRQPAGATALQARLTGLKLDLIVDGVESFVEDLGVQVLHHLKKNRTTEEVVEIVGPEGAFWQTYTSEDIQADVDVSVETFSAPKEDPNILRQQWLQIMQLTVQAMPVLQQTGQLQNLDFGALFGKVLEQFDEPSIGRFWKPAAAPTPPLTGEPGAGAGPGAGLPPGLAGQLAPGQVPTQPGAAAPEPSTAQDLLQQISGAGLSGGQPV